MPKTKIPVQDLTPEKLMKPHEIKNYLDKYVIGQNEAKKVLSVAIYNHYKKLLMKDSGYTDTELDKSNIMLLGSTGSGKTLMVKTIAKLLDVPCYIQDCTKITASGYVGSDVEDCIVGLLRSCNYNIPMAQRGIIMLDEGDKIATKGAGPSISRDVSGECVQQSLLKIVEGDIVGVPPAGGRKHPEQQLIYVDTSNILFILSGAFVGLDNIISRRIGKASIDFSNVSKANKESSIDYVTPQDLREFGMIPEFVGRFPVITNVNKLTRDDLARILTEPKNSIITQYIELMGFENVKLNFTEDAIDAIAEIAFTLGTGARGLRSIVETIMTDIMFEMPKKGNGIVLIDKEVVMDKTSFKYKDVAV